MSEYDPSSQAPPSSSDPFQAFWSYLKPRLLSFNIGHLMLILFGLHLFAMSFPNGNTCSTPNNACVFDESYYVPAANDLLNGVASNLEHPFFGKVPGALGIALFGNNFFGWRIFYVVIGVLTVWVFYELALMFFSKEKALIAASFLGFETLFFIHTSLLLLEGPPIFFGLLGFLLYFKRQYYLSALSLGLSILSKEWGLYFVIALVLYHSYYLVSQHKVREIFEPYSLKKLSLFAVILLLVVALPLWWYDLAYHASVNGAAWNGPWDNFAYYYSYHTSLTISASDAQNTWDHYAWGWILPINVNPSGYFVTTVLHYNVSNGTKTLAYTTHPIDWLGIGNLVVWYSIWAIVPFLILKPLLTRKLSELEAFVGIWIFATYAPSLYLSAIVHRVVYSFYFINVDPALALGIPMLVTFIAPEDLRMQRILLAVWLAAAIIFFILFFPIHPGPDLT